jgi:gamma-glutamyltranspeptidase/glutathione hydrolase
MVVAAHPLAAQAGAAVLDQGGNALDAAIAMQLVLNVVEPQSSGIGGGAFILFYDARARRLHFYDGRETAPRAATEALFLDASGHPLSFVDALIGGRSVGTPGLLRLLELAHRSHGRLPWARLFAPAIQAAAEGFDVSPRLHALLEADRFLRGNPPARALFYRDDGSALPIGTRLRNPALAAVLRTVARDGPAAFYEGAIAHDITAAVRDDPRRAGLLSEADLHAYRALERDPVCGRFLQYRVCGAAPPSSGGTTVLEMLGVLERTPLAQLPPQSLMSVHLFSEAGRLAFADRDRYLADPDYVSVPVKALLSGAYLDARRAQIDPRASMGVAQPGALPPANRVGRGISFEQPSTTHLSVIDRNGDAVSMSSSIESAFGSRTMVDGFLLNNELTDFSFAPERDGAPVANRVEAGKRPRSTMAPTIVFDPQGRIKMLLGSPGGSWIANFVAQVLVLTLAQGVPLDQALATPHWGSRNGPTELERGTDAERLRSGLELLGHTVRLIDMASGVHAIERVGDHWVGAADPRREGAASGR